MRDGISYIGYEPRPGYGWLAARKYPNGSVRVLSWVRYPGEASAAAAAKRLDDDAFSGPESFFGLSRKQFSPGDLEALGEQVAERVATALRGA